MAHLTHIAFAKGTHTYSQEEACEGIASIYPESFRKQFDIAEIFKNSQVLQRNFVLSLQDLLHLGDGLERHRHYVKEGLHLAELAAHACLEQAEIRASEIDVLLFVSSTGFSVPSLETNLMQNLGFSAHTQRVPIVGWGCTGGVAGLQLAMKLAQAETKSKILLINLETCSLAFQKDDITAKSVVANAIFNDGASAALVVGDSHFSKNTPSIHLIESFSQLFPNSAHLMGWEQRPSGLQVILSPEIPKLARQESLSFMESLLKKSGLSLEDIHLWMLHPGGAKILSALEAGLGLSSPLTQVSWDNLRENGNLSSCSVIVGLEKILTNPNAKGHGITCAFGPGFACEGLLFSK